MMGMRVKELSFNMASCNAVYLNLVVYTWSHHIGGGNVQEARDE